MGATRDLGTCGRLTRRAQVFTMVVGMVLTTATAHASVDGGWGGNADAEFVATSRNNAHADGGAVINYVRGRDAYRVSGSVTGVLPGSYVLALGTSGTCSDNTPILTFDVGDNGVGAFAADDVNGLSPTSTFDIVRIVPSGGGCQTHLAAPVGGYTNPDSGLTGQLTFRGQNRNSR